MRKPPAHLIFGRPTNTYGRTPEQIARYRAIALSNPNRTPMTEGRKKWLRMIANSVKK